MSCDNCNIDIIKVGNLIPLDSSGAGGRQWLCEICMNDKNLSE